MQMFPSSTTAGGFCVHVPVELQVCVPVQTFVDPHEVPVATGVCETPVCGSHASVVHGFPSSTTGAEPWTHVALESQVYAPTQRFELSAQALPVGSGVCETPFCGSQESTVHGFPSSTTSGGLWMHDPPPLHTNAPVHTSLEPQTVPALAGVWTAPSCGSHESMVHGFPSSTVTGAF